MGTALLCRALDCDREIESSCDWSVLRVSFPDIEALKAGIPRHLPILEIMGVSNDTNGICVEFLVRKSRAETMVKPNMLDGANKGVNVLEYCGS